MVSRLILNGCSEILDNVKSIMIELMKILKKKKIENFKSKIFFDEINI